MLLLPLNKGMTQQKGRSVSLTQLGLKNHLQEKALQGKVQ